MQMAKFDVAGEEPFFDLIKDMSFCLKIRLQCACKQMILLFWDKNVCLEFLHVFFLLAFWSTSFGMWVLNYVTHFTIYINIVIDNQSRKSFNFDSVCKEDSR